ncbi:hypothetical protein A3K93_00050 [Acinetobacter sp. NCu2D-2]|uniref:transporter n=1 Tax=Acinetobacter sp. NCu2D-2 TaxID=1608473 RepID=UPI0007CDA21D|nr:transporter [Acinetobacter sp. NCu2D-2]ANF80737.1 hypothetical protein A3K93_00050 [Acinetobacter sp. NCu2D-2]
MTIVKALGCAALLGVSAQGFAAAFEFDRPGTGFGTSTTPVGKLAWEQSLPSASYVKSGDETTTTLNADMLLRTGLTDSLELQVGWDGPAWSKTKVAGTSTENDGLGDINVGLKKSIDLQDEQLSFAVLAQAVIATGNDEFSAQDDLYRLGSSVAYQYNDDVNTSISMFYEWQDGDWAITAVPTLQYQIAGPWSGFSELVYRKQESQDNEYALGTGIMYSVNDRMQLDATVGVDLDGSARSYNAGLGVAFLF